MVRALDASDREGFYLAPGDGFVFLFKKSTFHRLAQGLSTPTPFANTTFNRAFFGQAAYRPADGMGRILLPEELKEACGIGGEAVLVGCGEYLEIWGPERLEAARKGAPRVTDLLQGFGGTGPATSR
jgi:DNA-binding transcriptional regulator/RsmH inhibitor MraZ